MLLKPEQSLLLLIDLQARLVPHVHDNERVLFNNDRLLQASHCLKIPRLVTEQNPGSLGTTVPQLRSQVADGHVLEKIHFNAYSEASIQHTLDGLDRRQLVLTGAESHVCVLQTALGLLQAGYQVFVAEDACSSRSQQDKQVALARLHQAGAIIVSTEMIMFEWLQRADSDNFRALLPLIR